MEQTWQLSEYDMERGPQEISLDSDLTLAPRSLYREIVCPICLDILNQTRAAPDCLHRFCKQCAEGLVKKECPVCRKKLPAALKSFREDAKFDSLIAKIYNGYRAKPLTPDTTKSPIGAPEVEVVLKHLHGQQTRFLKCPENTTVEHLTKYLGIRPDALENVRMPELENSDNYKLCVSANRSTGQFLPLPGSSTLSQVRDNHNMDSNRPLELYFYNF